APRPLGCTSRRYHGAQRRRLQPSTRSRLQEPSSPSTGPLSRGVASGSTTINASETAGVPLSPTPRLPFPSWVATAATTTTTSTPSATTTTFRTTAAATTPACQEQRGRRSEQWRLWRRRLWRRRKLVSSPTPKCRSRGLGP
ncbi:unnamed protein product, partial [Laminaria digitata]